MALTTPHRKLNQDNGEALRLGPSTGLARRRHLSWAVVGLVAMLAAGVLGAMLVARVADRQPVLALAQPIERGETLTAEHLRTVEVAVDGPVSLVPAESRFELIGLVATGPLPTGTLLSRDQLAEGPLIPDGFSVVGLSLEPGEYPVAALRPGDRVAVVRTPDASAATADVAVLAGEAEVFAVEPQGETTRTLTVSVAVPVDVAPAVASAAAEGRISLVLLGTP